MKQKVLIFLLFMSICLSNSSCIVTKGHHDPPHKEVPPGHKKKTHEKKEHKKTFKWKRHHKL